MGAALNCPGPLRTFGSPGGKCETFSSGNELALVRDVIDQDVFAEAIRRGDEDAAGVDPRQVVDELHHVRRALEHEGVNGDAVTRAADDLAQRLLERARCRWITEAD